MKAVDRFLRRTAFGVLLLVLLCAGAPAGLAEEDTPPEDEGSAEAADTELKEPDTAEAKKLLDALKKVAKKKNATQVLPAMEAMDGLKHESWDKTLIKLLKHKSSLVAVKAAEMATGRITAKNLKKYWKAAWADKANDKRFIVKAKVLRALGLFGHELDKNQYKEVERDWRWMIGNPNESYADALIDICFYFQTTKDKRHCRWMAEELDDPTANVNPNDPSTQPAAWQERRWKMWSPMKPAAVDALKAITGKEFDSEKEARAWFEANEKTFGFKW